MGRVMPTAAAVAAVGDEAACTYITAAVAEQQSVSYACLHF